MTDGKLKPAILIISDTASQDPSSDKAGAALTATFAAEGSWEDPVTKIVPDNVLDIQRTICNWTDGEEFFNLIVTTGGTGFAVKDNTPENLLSLKTSLFPVILFHFNLSCLI
ncbi:MoaB/Mog domain-containing protein [Thermoascus aurantiacus ATCC 26904]